MHITHQQLVDLVVPALATVRREWRDLIDDAVEAGDGLELDERDLNTVTWWTAQSGHVECLRLLLAAGVSQAGRDAAATGSAEWDMLSACVSRWRRE